MKLVDRVKQGEEMGNLKRFNTLNLDVAETRSTLIPSDASTFSCELLKSSLLLGIIGFLYTLRSSV